MRRFSFFETKVSLGHVLLLNAVTIGLVALFMVGASGVGASSPDTFAPAGTIRTASAQVPYTDVHVSNVVLTVLQFTVPFGKKADIMATYNGMITSEDLSTGVGLCQASMRLDSSSNPDLPPGNMTLLDKAVDNGSGFYGETRSLQARKVGVGAGLHTLYMMAGAGGTGCWYQQGTLFLVADIHS